MEFRLEPALERRDPGSVITAIALDDDGGRIYVGEWEKQRCMVFDWFFWPPIDRERRAIEKEKNSSSLSVYYFKNNATTGTSDGALEEWNRPSGGGRAVIGARRHVGASRKVKNLEREKREALSIVQSVLFIIIIIIIISTSTFDPKKKLSTQPVAAISYIGAARKIAALVDGNVSLLDEETLDAVPLPAGEGWRSGGGRGAAAAAASGGEAAASSLPLLLPSPSSGGITAIAAAPPSGAAAAPDAVSASCLAVAGRARGRLLGGIGGIGGGGTSRAAVFFVVPGRGVEAFSSSSTNAASKSTPPAAVCTHSVEWGEPLAVTTVAWAGSGALVLGSALRYSLWRLPPLSSAVAAAAGGAAASSPPSAVVPLLELSADAPAATPVALSLPSLLSGSSPSPPQRRRRKSKAGSSFFSTEEEEEEEEDEERATTAAAAAAATTTATATTSTAATVIPSAVLLLVERAGVAVGADGMPARGRPGAATFAEAPTALATVR